MEVHLLLPHGQSPLNMVYLIFSTSCLHFTAEWGVFRCHVPEMLNLLTVIWHDTWEGRIPTFTHFR